MGEMGWRKEDLDVVLVPSGLILMFGYHLVILHRYFKCPHNTVIGYENHDKRAWVQRMLQIEPKDRGLAIGVINSNISAATSMSSISLVLSSLIGAWIGSFSNNENNLFTTNFIYGNKTPSIIMIKYISLLSCFLISFTAFVQTTRCFVHANFLISMPNNSNFPTTYVERAVIRGTNFWTIGLRFLYLATNLLLWIFGPIPMFVCSVVMVGVLYNLDKNIIPLHQYNGTHGNNGLKKKNIENDLRKQEE